MELNTRVRSPFNTGTVVAIDHEKGTCSVHWDRFINAIEGIPIQELEIVSQ